MFGFAALAAASAASQTRYGAVVGRHANRKEALVALSLAVLTAASGFAVYSTVRILFSMISCSCDEAQRAVVSVTAKINSDSADEDIPPDLVLIDDMEGVYVHGDLQEVYYRRSVGGDTDWQWSWDADDWRDTDDLAGDQTYLLDPPSLIFILRLHLLSVARRKAAADERGGEDGSTAAAASGGRGGRQKGVHIPPPVQLPAWAEQQLSQQQGGCWDASHQQQQEQQQQQPQRHILDAPDILCCPITGHIMLQPVVTPCGKCFDYSAIRTWITQHGKDPHTQKALSVTQLYPNLVVREMVERWLETGDATADAQEQAAGHTSTRSGSSSSAAGHTTACGGGSSGGSRLQGQLQRQDSTSDPLSSFGVSSGSSTDSDS